MNSELMSILTKSPNYITQLDYVVGNIIEYDIRKANITMLYLSKQIDDDTYNMYLHMPKRDREIDVGKLIRSNPSIYKYIKQGITDCKHVFCEKNNIEFNQVIRIANDAMYINTNKPLEYTSFFKGIVEFVPKSNHNIFLKLNKFTFVFIKFMENNQMNLDIIGLNDIDASYHQNYFLGFICGIIKRLELNGIRDAIEYYNQFYKQYVNLELPLGYYRELSPGSSYRIKGSNLSIIDSPNINVNNIDINYNLFILRNIWKILMDMYTIQIK